MNTVKYSIVIPCYNEGPNLPLILARFAEVLAGKENIEIILVNNGSTDNSSQILRELLPTYPFAKVVDVEINQGYGFGILAGLKESKGQFVGWTHADMQTDPKDVLRAIDLIETTDSTRIFIKGNRKNRPWFDSFFTVGMSLFECILLGTWLWDINAQPTLFHRTFMTEWKNPPNDFSLDLFAIYHAKKGHYSILRFPVKFPPRIHGVSHWNTGLLAKWKFIKRTLVFSFQLKKTI